VVRRRLRIALRKMSGIQRTIQDLQILNYMNAICDAEVPLGGFRI
jgi:hypothetical protein